MAIRKSCHRLAAALTKLPSVLDVRLRGSMDLSLSGSSRSEVALRVFDTGDLVAAFDRWYEEAGRPWQDVADIERGLGRGGR